MKRRRIAGDIRDSNSGRQEYIWDLIMERSKTLRVMRQCRGANIRPLAILTIGGASTRLDKYQYSVLWRDARAAAATAQRLSAMRVGSMLCLSPTTRTSFAKPAFESIFVICSVLRRLRHSVPTTWPARAFEYSILNVYCNWHWSSTDVRPTLYGSCLCRHQNTAL